MQRSAKTFVIVGFVSLAVGGCVAMDEDEVAEDSAAQRTPNGLTSACLTQNALTTGKLSNYRMVRVPLTSQSYEPGGPSAPPELQLVLHDPCARQVMKYVYETAAPAGAKLEWKDPFNGIAYTWYGKDGKCSSWMTGIASTGCQQIVSGAVPARNNSQGREVILSMRNRYFPVSSSVAVSTNILYSTSQEQMYKTCTAVTTGSAECGFFAGSVGKCTVGSQMTATASGGDILLRVTENVAGAKMSSSRWLGDGRQSVIFQCTTGTFSVSYASWARSSASLSPPITTISVTGLGAKYPAAETSVFAKAEGVFFGNLWAKAPNCDVTVAENGEIEKRDAYGKVVANCPAGVIYPRLYAASFGTLPNWSASLNGRDCATTGACASEKLGLASGVCSTFNATGIGDVENCKGSDRVIYGVTAATYLNGACDLPYTGCGGI